MGKRDLILDTLQELLAEDKGAACSVSDIARRAGIAKGGLYYYFKSKEAVFDALVERTYDDNIARCRDLVSRNGGTAPEKLKALYQAYRSLQTSTDFDRYLHLPQNACIHQKSLARILSGLSPIVAEIIGQGVLEGSFTCPLPQETGEIILSVFCFLLDPGIFDWTPEQLDHRLRATASLIEAGLGAEPGSLDFFYTLS